MATGDWCGSGTGGSDMTKLEKVLREYAEKEIDGAEDIMEIKRDLLAILGDPHMFQANMFDRDQCSICKRNFRNRVHMAI